MTVKQFQAPTIERRLMDVKECAVYICSTPLNVYQMVSKKQIPFIKMRRSTRFDLREIDDWIEDQKNGTYRGRG